jgi:hypothetical protein
MTSGRVRRLFLSCNVLLGCYVGPPAWQGAADSSSGSEAEPPDESSTGTPSHATPDLGATPSSSSTTSGQGSEESGSSTGTVDETTGMAHTWDPIVADGDRMFFVGNSFTGNEGGLPEHLEAAWPSATSPLSIETEALYYYGQPLGAMFTTDVVTTIETGNFDTCVVTSGSLGEMLEFVPIVEASCDHLVVYMTWAVNPTLGSMGSYRDGTASIVATMRELEDTTEARVVPSGLVYYDLISNPPRDDLRLDWLYFPQNIHQNGAGVALNAYVFYAALVGQSPVGIDYDLVYPWDGTVILADEQVATRRDTSGAYLYDEIVFDEAFRTTLQQRAWDVTSAWFAGTTEFD